MRILIVSTNDNRGGAAKCAYRLGKSLIKKGHSVLMFVLEKSINEEWVEESKYPKLIKKLNHILDVVPGILLWKDKNVPFTLGIFGERLDFIINSFRPDIINFHWTGKGFVSFKEIVKQSRKNNTVLTLHDWNTFTGGSFYEIPKEKEKERSALAKWNIQRKERVLNKEMLNIVTPSNFVKNLAKNSPILNNSFITLINNGIDLSTFKINSKKKTREKYKLEKNKKYLLLGCSANDRAKGYDLLVKSLLYKKEYLESKDVGLLAYGSYNPFAGQDLIKIKVEKVFLGYIASEKSVSEIYSMSDILLYPSKIENYPLTLLESIASGTPVIAYNVGGNKEIIKNERFGILIEPFKYKSFANAIENLLLKNNTLSEKDSESFSIERMTNDYLELFNRIIL